MLDQGKFALDTATDALSSCSFSHNDHQSGIDRQEKSIASVALFATILGILASLVPMLRQACQMRRPKAKKGLETKSMSKVMPSPRMHQILIMAALLASRCLADETTQPILSGSSALLLHRPSCPVIAIRKLPV